MRCDRAWQRWPLRVAARILFVPTLLMNVVLHRRRWWTWVDERVLLGGLPLCGDARRLAREGVTTVLDLCAETEGLRGSLEKAGLRVHRVPMHEYEEPKRETLMRAVEILRREARQGVVYVHCKAGKSRSALVALHYLIAEHHLTAREAANRLRKARPFIDRLVAGSGAADASAQA